MCLEGHTSAVWNLQTQRADPQLISCAGDATVRLWDLAAGKSHSVLTYHKKGVSKRERKKKLCCLCAVLKTVLNYHTRLPHSLIWQSAWKIFLVFKKNKQNCVC